MSVPHQQDSSLDVSLVNSDRFRRVVGVVRNHLESIIAHSLQALDVQMAVPGKQIDPIPYELSNAYVHQEGISVLDGGCHRLPPARDHFEVEVLDEFDAHFSQMLGTHPHVLKHLGIVVRNLPAAHSCADVVVCDPYLITDLTRPGEVNGIDISVIGLSNRKQSSASIFRLSLPLLGKHVADDIRSRLGGGLIITIAYLGEP